MRDKLYKIELDTTLLKDIEPDTIVNTVYQGMNDNMNNRVTSFIKKEHVAPAIRYLKYNLFELCAWYPVPALTFVYEESCTPSKMYNFSYFNWLYFGIVNNTDFIERAVNINLFDSYNYYREWIMDNPNIIFYQNRLDQFSILGNIFADKKICWGSTEVTADPAEAYCSSVFNFDLNSHISFLSKEYNVHRFIRNVTPLEIEKLKGADTNKIFIKSVNDFIVPYLNSRENPTSLIPIKYLSKRIFFSNQHMAALAEEIRILIAYELSNNILGDLQIASDLKVGLVL